MATPFPEEVLRALNERLAKVKTKLPPASWVRPEAQHLTFAFLGEQPESVIDRIAPKAEEALRDSRVFEGALHGCGFFPNRRHARIGWCGVEPHEEFCKIAQSLRGAIKTAGVTFEENEFRPHLTLMRIRDHWPPLAIDTFEKALRDYRSAPFAVNHVTLYSSRLDPKGAVHTAVREFPLA